MHESTVVTKSFQVDDDVRTSTVRFKDYPLEDDIYSFLDTDDLHSDITEDSFDRTIDDDIK